MKKTTTLWLLLSALFFTGCESYPDNAKDVAVAMCEATKNLDIRAMKKYTIKNYGIKLSHQMENFKAALKNDDPKAIELKYSYAQIKCDDITLTEELGRVMRVNSSSPVISKMQLQLNNRVWKVIE